MKTVFISYSSQDREFSQKLASDLRSFGLGVWFDQWEIKVGDSIIERISQGIEKNDYLALVLSPTSVKSNWVKKELNSALFKEIEQKSVFVLPILYKKCKVPILLREKKYANFANSYESGLKELLSMVLPDEFDDSENLNKQLATYYVRKAIKYENDSNFKEAVDYYKKAQKLEPNYDEIYYHWGVLETRLNNISSAMKLFQRAIDVNPEHESALVNLGALADDQGDTDLSIKCFEKAIKVGVKDYACYRQLGQSYLRIGDYQRAIDNFLEAIVIVPNLDEYAITCLLLHYVYKRIREEGYSIAYLEEGLKMKEKLGKDLPIEFYFELAEGFLSAAMLDKASFYANRVLDIDKNNRNVSELLDAIRAQKESYEQIGLKTVLTQIKMSYEDCQFNLLKNREKRDVIYMSSQADDDKAEVMMHRIKRNDKANEH